MTTAAHHYRRAIMRRLFVRGLACGFLIFLAAGFTIVHNLAPAPYEANLPRFAMALGLVLLAVMGVFYALIQSVIFMPVRSSSTLSNDGMTAAAPMSPVDGHAGQALMPGFFDGMDDGDSGRVTQHTLDAEIANEMREALGDKFTTLLQLYLIDAQSSLDAILNTETDGAGVFTILRAAHALKAASAHIGAERLANLASELELDARRALDSNRRMETRRPYMQMKMAFDDTQKALAEWMERAPQDAIAAEEFHA